MHLPFLQNRHLVALLTVGFCFPHPLAATEPGSEIAEATEILHRACGDCHGEGADEGNFSLSEVATVTTLRDRFDRWDMIRQRIGDRSMPPQGSEPLSDVDRTRLISWIKESTVAAICRDGQAAGPPLLRRLARHEYSNTVRDLLHIHFDAGRDLPEDAAGGEGFSNAAETLFISPIHAEKYLQAAVDALEYASRDEKARRRLLSIRGGDESTTEEHRARESLQRLASNAFRRPVTDDDVERFVEVYREARSDGLSFEDAVFYAMRAILISPSFLFIAESSPQELNVPVPLTDHELAVRLSYFLWASTPDRKLRSVADSERLQDDEQLREQTLRLINDRGTHFQDSLERFVGSWLGTADLGRSRHVDLEQHPWVQDPHVAAMRNQPVYAMESILKNNESILALIDAPWTFLNDELVQVYQMKKGKFEEKFVQKLVRVELPEEYRVRGGLLGMAGVLAVNSYPRRSSPVLRGAWVLDRFLGVELPPPPPDVPALKEPAPEDEPTTLRNRLQRHRQDASCASCHDRMDPIGFALENFDEIGRWRDQEDAGPIDATGRTADGTLIDGPAGLKAYLLEQKETFARVVTRKMLGYALGRSLRRDDLCTVESIMTALREDEYRSQTLVLGIVTSRPFREKILTSDN